MQITCLGAARCVTGSCFLLDDHRRFLVDCGLFQGGKPVEALNRMEWGFRPEEISALFLTHAHIDHCGRIPKLVKDGFHGKIFSTLPTAELCKILLLDSAHIQEMEAEWQNRKRRRRGDTEVEPLYTVADAEACFPLFHVVQMGQKIEMGPNLTVAFRNAGHILGSSILELWVGPRDKPHKVIFSGDIGQKNQLIVQDPETIREADTLFIESTYGNRNHKTFEQSRGELLEAIRYSYEHREKVLIPAFAVERTQEILYILGEFFRKGLIPSMPVYLDSPLAIAATEIFRRRSDFYDDEALAILHHGQDPFQFPELVLSKTAEDSMAINQTPGSAIVIAGNGMCTAGRIKHHLKHNLWRRGCSVVIVGFQAEGTIGRRLVDKAASIKLLGETILVRAKVFTIGGFSAHADQQDLLDWISHFENPSLRVYAIHGEESISEGFAALVRRRFGFPTHVPAMGEVIRIPDTERELPPEKIEEPGWEGTWMRLARKVAGVRERKRQIPPDLLLRIEGEMDRLEKELDRVLDQVAGKKPG